MTIREKREALNLTQVECAIKAKVSLSTWRLWEAGATTPIDVNLKRMKAVLGE